MKDRADAILRPEQAAYLDSVLPARDPLLARMEQYAAEHGHPIADPEVAHLLQILVRIRQPKRIVEVGTNIGYSVVVMGRVCGLGTLIETIELDRDIHDTACEFVAEAALPCRVLLHRGAALETLSDLEGPFDFAFIDCVKTEYEAYLDELLAKMPAGSLIVCDNLLWKGQVAVRTKRDASTAALRRFNKRITTDPRLLTAILPLGDGVGISVVQ